MSDEAEDPRDRAFYARPAFIRKVNGVFTILWALWAIPAIAFTGLRNSVFLVALYSIWANIVSHYTAWLAARVEVRQEKIEIENVEEQGDGTVTAETTTTERKV